jgi:tetratricopeptide (TPR) repeat protein
MTSRVFLPCVIALGVGLCCAQESKLASWPSLVKGGKCEEARSICTGSMASKDAAKLVEAHKCLANAALCGNGDVVTLQPNDQGGGVLASAFRPEAVDDALSHLNQALKLAPQDISIHKGRLHLLEVSSRYADMTKALDESCSIYKGEGGVQEWLDYTSELFEEKQFRASLALLEVLNKHYPDSHDVLGNIGAIHLVLREDEQGINYLRRAVELAPKDPIDAWNLGRAYDYAEKVELADEWYQKALALDSDSARRKQNACIYAGFVENKLHDSKRACELQRTNCPSDQQGACAASK